MDTISLLGTDKAFLLLHKKLKIRLQNVNNFLGKLIFFFLLHSMHYKEQSVNMLADTFHEKQMCAACILQVKNQ